MFDIGLTEIIVVIVVSSLVLDIKDISSVIKTIRKLYKQLNNFVSEIKQFISGIEQEAKLTTKKVKDLEGKKRVAYDVDEIFAEIEKSKKDE